VISRAERSTELEENVRPDKRVAYCYAMCSPIILSLSLRRARCTRCAKAAMFQSSDITKMEAYVTSSTCAVVDIHS